MKSAWSWISPIDFVSLESTRIADRDAAGVEPGDERRDGARRHEGARAGDVADRLGHRLRHVRAGVEVELHHRHALNVSALDVMDPVDVEEVVLVIVGEEPLHLSRVHAAVGLADVDDGEVQIGKDVDRHPERKTGDDSLHRGPQLEVGKEVERHPGDGHEARERNGGDQDHHGQRPSHGEDDRIHGVGPSGHAVSGWPYLKARSMVREASRPSGRSSG